MCFPICYIPLHVFASSSRIRLKFGERSFSCAGPRAWNSFPSSLQELTDTKTFKRKLKTKDSCSFIGFVLFLF